MQAVVVGLVEGRVARHVLRLPVLVVVLLLRAAAVAAEHLLEEAELCAREVGEDGEEEEEGLEEGGDGWGAHFGFVGDLGECVRRR